MDPATGIQVQGELEKYPFIEALHEASAAALSGSFRVFFGEKKAIVYLREGRVVFAVSNAKRFRLAGIVLERPDIDRTAVARFKDINNDIEFARQLVDEPAVRFDKAADDKELALNRVCGRGHVGGKAGSLVVGERVRMPYAGESSAPPMCRRRRSRRRTFQRRAQSGAGRMAASMAVTPAQAVSAPMRTGFGR